MHSAFPFFLNLVWNGNNVSESEGMRRLNLYEKKQFKIFSLTSKYGIKRLFPHFIYKSM